MQRPIRLSDTRSAPKRDVSDELRFHLEMRTQEFIERGLAPAEAREAALASFGDLAAVRAECEAVRERRARARRWHDWRWNVAADTRYAVRTLRRSPLFTAAAVLTLGFGIAAATIAFTLVNGVLLRPLPYADPGRLAMVWTRGEGLRGVEPQWPLSIPNYLDIKAEARAFASVAAFRFWPYTLAAEDGGQPEMLAGARVAPELFATLGVRPALGRGFTANEARPGAPRVAVIGHDLWHRHFGASPAALGRAVTLSGERYTIVGVMPAGFSFPRGAELPPGLQFRPRTEIWTPLRFTEEELAQRGTNNLAAVARLRSGVTLAQTRADLARIARRLAAAYPRAFSERMGLDALPLAEQAAAPVRHGLLLLLGAVGVVLLIACANVANLLVLRAAGRGAEFATRTALGATRGRLFGQLATEALLLTMTAAAIGLGVAAIATPTLLSSIAAEIPGGVPRADDVALDVRVVLVTAAVALMAGLAFAVGTALSVADGVPGAHAGARVTGGHRLRSARRALVVAEVALSLVLLAGAGLLTRSFVALQRVAPGFVPDGVMTAGLLMPIGSRFDPVAEGPRWAASFGAYIERLAAIPGVVAAGGVSSLPLSGAVETASFVVEGRPTPPGAQHPSADYAVATADYFRAIGIPLIAGRTFDARDDPSGVRVIVVSAAFARSTWPDVPVREVLGRRILLGFAADAPHAVVGVVGDVRQTGLDAAAAPAMYFPSAQMPYPFLTLVVRTTSADAAAIAPSMREALRALDAGLALHDVRPLRAVVDASIARQRFAMAVTGAFAVAALLLAAIGLYGVIAYGVAQRTREIGLRVALGAGPRQVLALVVGEGMRVTAVGVALGLAIALAGSRLLQGLLYGVQATDITVHAAVALLTLGVAFVASYLPARRAALIDPAVTLRGE